MNDHITCYEEWHELSSQRQWELYQKQRAEIERMLDQLSDIENSIVHAIDERHDDGTVHCTCVPVLRVEIKRLQKELMKWEKWAKWQGCTRGVDGGWIDWDGHYLFH